MVQSPSGMALLETRSVGLPNFLSSNLTEYNGGIRFSVVDLSSQPEPSSSGEHA